MTRSRPLRIVFAVVAGCLVASGCGGGEEQVAPPRPVPVELVPAAVQADRLSFYETQLPGAEAAFSEAGPDSLAADGRVWELRLGDRLVGVLQLTTLVDEVDLTDADHRDPIINQLLPTARDRIDIGDISVWTGTSSGKTTYLWFGEGMFSLLTIKPASDDNIEPELVLQDVLDHMVASPEWAYIYFDDDDDEDGA